MGYQASGISSLRWAARLGSVIHETRSVRHRCPPHCRVSECRGRQERQDRVASGHVHGPERQPTEARLRDGWRDLPDQGARDRTARRRQPERESAKPTATLYLHGLGFGEWMWHFTPVPAYDYAALRRSRVTSR